MMVDSITSSGLSQGLEAVRRAQQAVKQREQGNAEVSSFKDSVRISDEALSLSEAEGQARDVRVALEANPRVSLGLDPNFDTTV
jgi:hypothetical protein